CVTDPAAPECANYVYPAANATADIKNLCTMMSYMPVCTVQASCDSAKLSTGICQPFSILADSCTHDMPGMGGCKNFVSLCNTTGSVVNQCKDVDMIDNLPTTMATYGLIKDICTEMAMDGCENCVGTGKTMKTCGDLLTVYSDLCMQMPDMSQCKAWQSMCLSTGNLAQSDLNGVFCEKSNSNASPIMKMFFHTGIIEYVLFKSWVPRTNGQFAGTWFAIFFFAILFEIEKTARAILEKKWQPKKDDNALLINSAFLGGSYPSFSYRDIIRGCLHGLELTCSYLLMLICMLFNVALFFAVIAGVIVGNILVGRYRNYSPRVTCCE
ncbi:hypothetical protein DICPUDRAFT_17426, partial [Dictyostelium purpureum]